MLKSLVALAAIPLLFFFIFFQLPPLQVTVQPQSSCITAGDKICALSVYRKSHQIQTGKGYSIQTQQTPTPTPTPTPTLTLIQLRAPRAVTSHMSISDWLQTAEYQPGLKIKIQNIPSITQIILQLSGIVSYKNAQSISIPSSVSQFILLYSSKVAPIIKTASLAAILHAEYLTMYISFSSILLLFVLVLCLNCLVKNNNEKRRKAALGFGFVSVVLLCIKSYLSLYWRSTGQTSASISTSIISQFTLIYSVIPALNLLSAAFFLYAVMLRLEIKGQIVLGCVVGYGVCSSINPYMSVLGWIAIYWVVIVFRSGSAGLAPIAYFLHPCLIIFILSSIAIAIFFEDGAGAGGDMVPRLIMDVIIIFAPLGMTLLRETKVQGFIQFQTDPQKKRISLSGYQNALQEEGEEYNS